MNKERAAELAVAFGDFIREGRLKKMLSQFEVAKLAGISQAYYCYIEIGERVVDLNMALTLCDCLGLDLNDFVQSYNRS